MGYLQSVVHPANHHWLFAPVELEGFAQFELERYECTNNSQSACSSPAPDVSGDAAVAACISLALDLFVQRKRAVRLSCLARLLSARSAKSRCTIKGAMTAGGGSRRLGLGSLAIPSNGSVSHLRIVILDTPVCLEISRIDFLSRRVIRLTLPILTLLITPKFSRLIDKQESGTPGSL